MFAAINSFLTGGASKAKDPYWANVSMLLHGDGTNAAQNNTFLDTSTNNFTVTRNGNTTQGSFNPFVKTYPYAVATNGGSAYFDGTGDYLTLADNAAFNLAANDFTIECWVNFTSLSGNPVFAGQIDSGFSALSFYLQATSTGALFAAVQNSVGASSLISVGAGAVSVGNWYHFAFVRNGNTARLYVNGIQVGTVSVIAVIVRDSTSALGVGNAGDYTSQTLNGYISNFRLVNGTCLYPSGTTFTPPTVPLTAVTNTALLLGMSNGAIYDNTMLNNLETVGNSQISTSTFKYGTGALKFNGTTDYLPTPTKTTFALGSGDFTIEGWINQTATQNAYIAGQADSTFTTAGSAWFLYVTALAPIFGVIVGATQSATSQNLTAPTNTWTHIAGVRDGSTIRLYVNGVQSSSAAVSGIINSPTSSVSVGRAGDYTGAYFNGYIDDFRFTKGICRYPSGTTFTPPTAAFPNSGP
jgi:hypothetical protein